MINVYADGDVIDYLGENGESFDEAPHKEDINFEIIDYTARKGTVSFNGNNNMDISVFRRYDYKGINLLIAHGVAVNYVVESDPEYEDEEGELLWFANMADIVNSYFSVNHLIDDYKDLSDNEGVLLEMKGGVLNSSIVTGTDRPDLLCMTVGGKQIMARPYKDEIYYDRQEDIIIEPAETNGASTDDLHFFIEERVKDILAKEGETKLLNGDTLSFDIINSPIRCYLRCGGDETTFNVCRRQNVGVSNDTPTLSYKIHWGDEPKTELKSNGRIGNNDSDLIRTLLFVVCKLNSLVKEKKLIERFAGINPEEQGIYVENLEGEYIFTLVEGKERPDLLCQSFLGGLEWARPYIDEMWEEFQNQDS